jgi:hypothetical protein
MRKAEKSCPNTDISPEVARDGVTAFAKDIAGAYEQADGQQHKRGVGCGEAGTSVKIAIGPSVIKSDHADGRRYQE